MGTAAIHIDQTLINDFALAAADFDGIDKGPAVKAMRKAAEAMRHAVEVAHQEEQAAVYWLKRISDWAEWSRMPEGDIKQRAAALLIADFEDKLTAFDFLTCPPLTERSLERLSSGGLIPTNAYEQFAAGRWGKLAEEMELAEKGGPVERYTYRLRMLRGLGESRSAIYRWRKLGRTCGASLIDPRQEEAGVAAHETAIRETQNVLTLTNERQGRAIENTSVFKTTIPMLKAAGCECLHWSGANLGRVRDGP